VIAWIVKRLRALRRATEPKNPSTFECPECGTHYFEPQPCDWCPGQHTTVFQPPRKATP
jgi:hypothetical protein